MSSEIAESSPFGGTDKLNKLAWGTLLVLCGALFLDALDVSMMGVALPSIRTDLNMSTSSLQWVVSAYVLGYGGFCCSADGPLICSGAGASSWSRSVSSSSPRCSGASRTTDAADRHPLHQGRERGVHGARGPVDHHDDVHRGAGAQQGAVDLHRDRRDRVLARARLRRAPDRDRLALGLLPSPRR